MTRSPWQRVLGDEFETLDPQLKSYFGPIPPGAVGRGSGVFSTVGTPRRWLWPILALLEHDGIAFARWERDVPFTIENRSTSEGTVRARRVFHFRGGDRVMVDQTGVTLGGLVDRLGHPPRLSAALTARAKNGGLRLDSTSLVLRLGRLRVRLGVLSPRVHLTESVADGVQKVSLRIDAPLVGRVYEYSGSFSYTVGAE